MWRGNPRRCAVAKAKLKWWTCCTASNLQPGSGLTYAHSPMSTFFTGTDACLAENPLTSSLDACSTAVQKESMTVPSGRERDHISQCWASCARAQSNQSNWPHATLLTCADGLGSSRNGSPPCPKGPKRKKILNQILGVSRGRDMSSINQSATIIRVHSFIHSPNALSLWLNFEEWCQEEVQQTLVRQWRFDPNRMEELPRKI